MAYLEIHGRANGKWGQFLTDPELGAQELEFAGGATIYDPRTASRCLYLVQSGQVRTYEGGPDSSARLLEILGPGDWFGEEALAQAERRSSAVAVSASVLCSVPVERLMDLLSGQPGAALELIRQLASRLQAARNDANGLVFEDCSARLVKTLLRFSASAAAIPQDNGSVMLHITHRQLAQAVGAARETISLALTQLRQQNLLRTGRNRLLFQPEALKAFSRNGKEVHNEAVAPQ